jgi:hypothetical protein
LQETFAKNGLLTSPEIIMKVFTYLNVFDNSPLPRKNINFYEMIYYAVPGAINIKDGKWYLRRDRQGAGILIDTFRAIQMLTTEYKNILSFSLDDITVPEQINGQDFGSMPAEGRIKIVLDKLKYSKGFLPVKIIRNKKLIEKK